MHKCRLNNMRMDAMRKSNEYQAVVIDLALAGVLDRDDVEKKLLGYKIPEYITEPQWPRGRACRLNNLKINAARREQETQTALIDIYLITGNKGIETILGYSVPKEITLPKYLASARCRLNSMAMYAARKENIYQAVVIDLVHTGMLDSTAAERLLGYRVPMFRHPEWAAAEPNDAPQEEENDGPQEEENDGPKDGTEGTELQPSKAPLDGWQDSEEDE